MVWLNPKMTLPEDTLLENRYRIDGLLAHGGMGAIYRAFDTNLNTPVAIKENFFQTPERIAQFKQEALILARLRHPALPRVIHHFSFEGQQYLVMDFIEGNNLWEIIRRQGEPLDEREALEYIIQVCHAVNYLHRQRPPIIHRDIKPQNIKITPAGQAVLVDFGIAKQVTGDSVQTQTGAQAATPGFSPPEQYSGSGTTPASDIYALGATLYAILTGKKPPNSVSLMVGKAKFKAPNVINPKLSSPTNQAVLHAMQPKPQSRPQSVIEWRHQLEAILRMLPQTTKDETLASTHYVETEENEETVVAAVPLPAALPAAIFWLVDSRGVGYPITQQPLRIGRHSQADIIVEDRNVSRFHAQVKTDGTRCFVLDENSANGTFLNGHQLGADWYPFNQGDVFIIGPARFYLTTTRPVKVALPRSGDGQPESRQLTQKIKATDKMQIANSFSPAEAEQSQRSVTLLLFIMTAIIIAILLIGGYLWINPAALDYLNFGSTGNLTAVVAGNNENSTAAPSPSPAHNTATSTPAAGATNIAQTAQANVTETIRATGTATSGSAAADSLSQTTTSTVAVSETIPTKTPTATSTKKATVTPRATATVLSTRASTTDRVTSSNAPTPSPLQSFESMPALGSREVIDVDINPKNPNEVYALVKRDGIYKSVNGGDGPWARIDLDGASFTALVIDPADPLRLYAPTWNAVLKSVDGGNTWEAKTNGLVSNQVVDTLTIHPKDSNIMYAGIGETLVVSADQGETWSSAAYGAGLGVSRLYQIVVDPFDSNTLVVAGLAGSIYKSTDGGRNFVQLPVNVGRGTFGLAAHPRRPNVYLAGINSWDAGILKSDNGVDFRSVSDGLIYGGADSAYSALIFAPADPNVVFAGSGFESNPDAKGMFKSTNAGESWIRINTGLAINPDTGYQYYVKSIAVHPTNPDIIFIATGSGLYKSTDGGQTWAIQ